MSTALATAPAPPTGSRRSSGAYWVIAVLAAGVVTPHGSIISAFVVLAVLSAPSWFPTSWRNTRYRRLFGWALVWFLAQVISDLYHGTTVGHALLGSWQPAVAVVSIGFFLYCYHQARSTLAVIFVAMLTQPIFFHFAAFEGTAANPWKYIYGVPACLVGAAVLDRFLPGRRVPIAMFFLAASVGNFVVDYRSLAGELFVAAVIMLARGSSAKARARALVVGLLAVVLAVPLLLFAIHHGYASQDYKRQHPTLTAPTSPKQYVLEGRPEFLVSSAMIEAHPWLGLGSSHVLTAEDVLRIRARAKAEDIGLSSSEQNRLFGDGANTHSLLPNSWVSAGILAVPFWLYALYLMVSSLTVGRQATAVLTLGTPLLLWDAFFSPWSGHYEMLLGVLVGLALYQRQRADAETPDVTPT